MWVQENQQLYQKFAFANFLAAFAFMQQIAVEAEKLNHHPRWLNHYNIVEIWLTTHDAGNTITEKDYQLASIIDALVS